MKLKNETVELANKIYDDDFNSKNYKEQQQILRARSKVGKWIHKGGTLIKKKKINNNTSVVQNYLADK